MSGAVRFSRHLLRKYAEADAAVAPYVVVTNVILVYVLVATARSLHVCYDADAIRSLQLLQGSGYGPRNRPLDYSTIQTARVVKITMWSLALRLAS